MKHNRTVTCTGETYEETGKTIRWQGVHGETTRKEKVKLKRVVEGEVELVIDVERILNYLGRHCLLNKGGRAELMSGMIKMKRLSSKELVHELEQPAPLKTNETYV